MRRRKQQSKEASSIDPKMRKMTRGSKATRDGGEGHELKIWVGARARVGGRE